MQYKGFRDLTVYKKAYRLALDIFKSSKQFPAFERYSLTDQIRRSSRSVAANIAEAWPKRLYEKLFTSTLIRAAGEASETGYWLDMALELQYLNQDKHKDMLARCIEVEKMLWSMIHYPGRFTCDLNRDGRRSDKNEQTKC